MVSHKLYVPALENAVSCETEGVVYCLRCSNCNIVYVGETKRSLKRRISEHLYNISQNNGSSLLVSHFQQCPGNIKVSVLESVSKRGSSDNQGTKALLLSKENKWIRILNSAFPFGLNDNIKGYGLTRDITDPTQHKNAPYLNYPIYRRQRGHGQRKRKNKTISLYSNWCELKKICEIEPSTERYRWLYVTLLSFNKRSMHNCLNSIQTCSAESEKELELKLAILAITSKNCEARNTCTSSDVKRFHMPFHKVFDDVGLKSVLLDKKLLRLMPGKKFGKQFTVSFRYEAPVSRRLCNYGSFLASLNKNSLIDVLNSDCDCNNSLFQYGPAGHVVTGNLAVVGKNLADIMKEGAKFRMEKAVVFEKIIDDFSNVLHSIIKWDAQIKGVQEKDYERFKEGCLWLLQKRCGVNNIKIQKDSTFKGNVEVELQQLHKKYIVTTADKAPNNFIIICKKYYALLICNELGVSLTNGTLQVSGNAVYEAVDQNVEQVVDVHNSSFRKYQGVIVEENRRLPRFFAIPKMHKNPYKFRFIAGARLSSLKVASMLLHRLLQFFKNHFMSYTAVIRQRAHIETCWTVKGCREIHSLYAKLSGTNINSITTADFSTMFTAFEHDIIVQNVNSLISLCFKNSGKSKVAISSQKIWYTEKVCTGKQVLILDKYDCYDLVHKIVDNTFVVFTEMVFRQNKGVPMGGNASPMLADLSLAMIEYSYLSKNKREAQELSYTRRYIDDVLCINGQRFQEIANKIYPKSLALELTSNNNRAAFLDTFVQVGTNKKLQVAVYNKTDDFNFEVKRYTTIRSCISKNVGYNVFYGEIVRFSRITNSLEKLAERVSKLLKDFTGNGFEQAVLYKKLVKFINAQGCSLRKFSIFTDKDKWRFIEKIWSQLQ